MMHTQETNTCRTFAKLGKLIAIAVLSNSIDNTALPLACLKSSGQEKPKYEDLFSIRYIK